MHGFNWIESLAEHERKAMTQRSGMRVVAASNTLFRQGDAVKEVYQIVSGEARQCILTEDGQEVLMYIYRAGDVVGDSSCEDLEPYPVTVLTRGETVVRYWKVKDFIELRAEFPAVELAVVRQTSARLRAALRVLEEMLTLPAAARVASRLFWLGNQQGEEQGVVTLDISQQDISLMVGCTRQTVSKVVTELRSSGVISTDYGRILIHDAQGLMRYSKEQLEALQEKDGRRVLKL